MSRRSVVGLSSPRRSTKNSGPLAPFVLALVSELPHVRHTWGPQLTLDIDRVFERIGFDSRLCRRRFVIVDAEVVIQAIDTNLFAGGLMYLEFSRIIGMVFVKIENTGNHVLFTSRSGRHFQMYHDQDCCERVSVEEIVGDLDDLINTPILRAEERSQNDPDADEHGSWTFYEFATIKGSVTIRWYGSSNGCYGVEVSFEEVCY